MHSRSQHCSDPSLHHQYHWTTHQCQSNLQALLSYCRQKRSEFRFDLRHSWLVSKLVHWLAHQPIKLDQRSKVLPLAYQHTDLHQDPHPAPLFLLHPTTYCRCVYSYPLSCHQQHVPHCFLTTPRFEPANRLQTQQYHSHNHFVVHGHWF